MEGGDNKLASFTVPALKAFLKVRSQNVSGNKQELVARAIGWQKNVFFSANSRSSGSPKNNVKTLSFPFPITFPL